MYINGNKITPFIGGAKVSTMYKGGVKIYDQTDLGRWYYNFDSINDSIRVDINLTGDFELKGKFTYTEGSGKGAVLGSIASANWLYLLINPDSNSIELRFINQLTSLPISNISAGENLFSIKRVSGVVTVDINGNEASILSPQTQDVLLEGFGAWGNGSWGTNRLDGYIYDVAYYDSSGNLLHFYPINDGIGSTEILDTVSGNNGTPLNFDDVNWSRSIT